MGISENIKYLRVTHDLTQDEFGRIAGVSGKAVCTWEKGIKEPRMGALQKIADYFGISKSSIIEDGGLFNKTGSSEKPSTILTRKDKRDIQDVLDEMKKQLQNGDLLFDGLPVSDEDTIAIIAAMETAMNIVKQKNKETYTPKKYRKDDGD